MKRRLILILIALFKESAAQENLSRNGTATQSSNYRTRYADLAIIGGPSHDFDAGSCSATNSKQNISWWMLTFPSDKVFVSNVIIYYRSNSPGRLAGYYLFVTNSSISSSASSPPDDGHLCYRHTGNTLPKIVQNVTCNQLGKYVIIYNERRNGVNYPRGYSDIALLELCDVQVIGCYKSWWGEDCKNPCPSYCIDHHCHPNNGTCIWGCSSGNCLSNECSSNGLCTKGCLKGRAGLFCNKRNIVTNPILIKSDSSSQPVSQLTDGDKRETSCITLNGTNSWLQIDTGQLRAITNFNFVFRDGASMSSYSIYISNTSSRSEEVKVNDNMNKTRTFPFHVHEYVLNHPVIVGRYVILSNAKDSLQICEVEILGCLSGLYGDSCGIKCPLNCDGDCHPETGACVFGCNDGYHGSFCNKACIPPRFGRSCIETCRCIKQPCYFITGICPSSDCQEGWTGQSCSKEISCRLNNISRNLKYLPNTPVLRFNQNVTFYCAGFYGTSSHSTCSEYNHLIPPPPICTDGKSTASSGVSLPVFVSVTTTTIVISVVVIVTLLIINRRNRNQQMRRAGEQNDFHVYTTPSNKPEDTNDAYDELK